ncbi:unnamed protein product, partial [Ectocarpus fasciculatus]
KSLPLVDANKSRLAHAPQSILDIKFFGFVLLLGLDFLAPRFLNVVLRTRFNMYVVDGDGGTVSFEKTFVREISLCVINRGMYHPPPAAPTRCFFGIVPDNHCA